VLGEKPAAMNYAEAESMAQAARASGRLWGVAYYRRLYPKLLRTRQLIAEGAIGQPVLAEANCHSWLPRSGAELALGSGAGGRRTALRHRVPPHRRLQLPLRAPARATGLLSNAVHQLAVEDSATVLIDYPTGVRGIVDVRWNSHIERDQFRVIGTDGEINLDPLNGPLLRWRARRIIAGACQSALPGGRELRERGARRRAADVPRRRGDLDGLGD
jgi:1,5-anhydro-D-fructose reductase (1,5-anhydro-D-mannitol-forming)